MAVPARFVKLARILNKLSVLGVVSLILLIVSAISLILFFSFELKKIDASVKLLKNEISSLEKSEQKLIFVKDKLGKIASIRSLESAESEIIQFKKLNEILSASSGSVFTKIDIGSTKTEVSLSSIDSQSLAFVLGSFTDLKDYGKITLSSLSFNLSSGFLSSFIIE